MNSSDNYRAIALSSIFGKMVDKILLTKCQSVFLTSDFQYGFKKKHSTNQCTFVVNEIIQYYNNNGSNVLLTLLDASKAFDRVQYIKLFRLLLSKNICPIVARFLTVMYTNQTFRVMWCTYIGDIVSASNGVKQGGVMSPLLFTVYVDELLVRLSKSKYGCYVGQVYCGSFGYADDVVLLAPTVFSLNIMLSICSEYAAEYDVLFNADKTKLILCNGIDNTAIPDIQFMGKSIAAVSWDKHLGFPIGKISNEQIMTDAVNDFMSRVNMVKSHFKQLPTNIMYHMFKTYCMPLYGCPLWDYSNRHIAKFYVAWRKAIRYILKLPYTTHCNLLHLICEDIPVEEQLYSRFLRFLKSLMNSTNAISQLCSNLALYGSGSNVCRNISMISHYLTIDRFKISESFTRSSHVNTDTIVQAKSNMIIELLDMRYMYRFVPAESLNLTLNQCTVLLETLCTD